MTQGSVAALAFVALLAGGTLHGCGPRAIVIGSEPRDEDDGEVTGGGGSFGGSAGTIGTAVGGAPAGGASFGGTPAGGAPFDPYPPVAWEDGQGYRRSCPMHEDGTWGFTCWNFDTESRSCRPDGNPACNACSCAVPCESDTLCPLGVTGHPSECIASATTVGSCFLVCHAGDCPEGMTCAEYPGNGRRVCVWLDEREPTK